MRGAYLKLFAICLVSAPAVVQAGYVQLPGLEVPSSAAADRDSVVRIFSQSYNAYRSVAFGHDEVAPVSQKPLDPRNGWGATIVDAMSTMYIMNLTDFFEEALNFTQTIDFTESKTSGTVSIFESTIRYLGGLISAYELSGKQHSFLIDKAKQLADRLSLGWSRGNTIPFGFVDFSTNQPIIQTSNIAEAGTLTLEWSRLSEYTGNDTYRKLAEGSVLKIASNVTYLYPGLPGQGIDPATGNPVGGYVTWGGGSDSYFEYLIKYAQLSNTNNNVFADSWLTAVDSSIKTLVKTSTIGNHVYLADFDDQRLIRHVGSHLACFYAGNWLLGGKLTNNDTIVNLALQLNDACWNTYAGDATKIGPEVFAYISSDGNFTGDSNPSDDQIAFYQEHGYYITDAVYVQRPEVLESNFYAWRVTGDPVYLQRAQSAVASFQTFLSTPTGFTGIYDVNNPQTEKIDETESFWFAEVLKYLYLTFDDPSHISLDDYVFNTEAHPLLAPKAESTYGSGQLIPSTTNKFVLRPGPLPAVSPLSLGLNLNLGLL
ncbi:glycoside hydrolase family 47 protein [Multifurca ochricompacta]|uniref:alpha-1,2-Mannosidase n=1 Tax=Multifurca ochricompacta TaxID=376703 RepID=A0AAD4LT38_9AGAM|nr:glycoside hydrolase family 47 protein [Multifurca ochricompacta]